MTSTPITKRELKLAILKVATSYGGKPVNKSDIIGRSPDTGDLSNAFGRPLEMSERALAASAFDELLASGHLRPHITLVGSSTDWATTTEKGNYAVANNILDPNEEIRGSKTSSERYFEFPLSPSEQLLCVTARIEALNTKNGNDVLGTGTSFFFQFEGDNASNIPILVTNRHVVEDYSLFRVYFSQKNGDGSPNILKQFVVTHDRNGDAPDWIYHPDNTIDLAVLPLAPLLRQIEKEHNSPYFIELLEKHIPSAEQWKQLDAIEEILMIGYPNGLWDNVHNRPLVRRGITASHPAVPFKGKKEFVIDAACFTGSSGSPVFLYNPFGYREKNGDITLGSGRFFFLGILRAGTQHKVKGGTQVVDIPMADKEGIQFTIPNNLGFVIRSDLLTDFLPLLSAEEKT